MFVNLRRSRKLPLSIVVRDIYRQFIEECVAEAPNSMLSLTEIYAQFKEWLEGWSNMPLPIKNEVKDYFEKLWGDMERVLGGVVIVSEL